MEEIKILKDSQKPTFLLPLGGSMAHRTKEEELLFLIDQANDRLTGDLATKVTLFVTWGRRERERWETRNSVTL